MSLLENAFEPYKIIDKTTVSDGYGGYNVVYTESVTINGAMVYDTSMDARTALKAGVKSVYTFTTKKNVILSFHQIIKRVSDGKIFRITSDGEDKKTPYTATLNMRQVTCEEWELTNNE